MLPRSVDFLTIVHPFLPGWSPLGGYELGAWTWVYENASVDEELFRVGLGTGFGAVVEDDARAFEERFQSGLLVDSESEALSQASSSPQSLIAYEENLFVGLRPMWGRAGGGRAAIWSTFRWISLVFAQRSGLSGVYGRIDQISAPDLLASLLPTTMTCRARSRRWI